MDVFIDYDKFFPVMLETKETISQYLIPLEIMKKHEAQALRNHGQNLSTLAHRGGLSWSEVYFILLDMKYRRRYFLDNTDARPFVQNLVNLELGHSQEVDVRKYDSEIELLVKGYHCKDNEANFILLNFCLSRLNEGFDSNIQDFDRLVVPLLFISGNCKECQFDGHYGVKKNMNLYHRQSDSRCNVCGFPFSSFELELGCNDSTLNSRLCTSCCNELYKLIGVKLNADVK